MNSNFHNCPNCYCVQPITAKNCSLCGAHLQLSYIDNNIDSKTVLIKKIKDISMIFGVVVFLSWLLLPAPFNPAYLVKRIFQDPTAVCRDGVYRFSASRSGACSGHGGVKKWLKRRISAN